MIDKWIPFPCNAVWGGPGYIAGELNPDPDGIDGIVTINDVPGAREIEIRERKTRRVVAVGFSNADGTYRFDCLNPDVEFDVIARDWSRTYTDVIVPARRPATRPLMQPDTWDVPIGVPFSRTVPVRYGVGAVTVSITGTLPSGLTATDATISGAWPTGTPGDYPLKVSVEDAVEQTATATVLLRLVLLPLEIVTPLPNFTDGVPASVTLVARGGEGPYTYAVTSGALPAGLSLNGSTGEISGTPTTPGAYSFDITVTAVRPGPATKTFAGSVLGKHAYWRLNITAHNGNPNTSISELRMRDSSGINVATGGTAFANTEYSSGYVAGYAFDGNSGTRWAANGTHPLPHQIGYIMAVPENVVAVEIVSASSTDAPRDFIVQSSDDGVSWTDEWSVTGSTGWGANEQRTFARP